MIVGVTAYFIAWFARSFSLLTTRLPQGLDTWHYLRYIVATMQTEQLHKPPLHPHGFYVILPLLAKVSGLTPMQLYTILAPALFAFTAVLVGVAAETLSQKQWAFETGAILAAFNGVIVYRQLQVVPETLAHLPFLATAVILLKAAQNPSRGLLFIAFLTGTTAVFVHHLTGAMLLVICGTGVVIYTMWHGLQDQRSQGACTFWLALLTTTLVAWNWSAGGYPMLVASRVWNQVPLWIGLLAVAMSITMVIGFIVATWRMTPAKNRQLRSQTNWTAVIQGLMGITWIVGLVAMLAYDIKITTYIPITIWAVPVPFAAAYVPFKNKGIMKTLSALSILVGIIVPFLIILSIPALRGIANRYAVFGMLLAFVMAGAIFGTWLEDGRNVWTTAIVLLLIASASPYTYVATRDMLSLDDRYDPAEISAGWTLAEYCTADDLGVDTDNRLGSMLLGLANLSNTLGDPDESYLYYVLTNQTAPDGVNQSRRYAFISAGMLEYSFAPGMLSQGKESDLASIATQVVEENFWNLLNTQSVVISTGRTWAVLGVQ